MKALLPLLLLAAAPAPGTCPAGTPFAGFEAQAPIAAARARRGSPLPRVAIGRAAAVSLSPTRALVLETPAAHAAAPDSHGGMLELAVPLSGRYRIALDGRAWIDLVRGGKTVASAAHGHGPDCGPVRKIVDFDLAAGTYTIQLSDATTPIVALMIAPAR